MSQTMRAWIYRGLVVVGVAAIIVGWVSEEQVVMILGLAAQLLGNITSSVYTPWKNKEVAS